MTTERVVECKCCGHVIGQRTTGRIISNSKADAVKYVFNVDKCNLCRNVKSSFSLNVLRSIIIIIRALSMPIHLKHAQ